MCDLLSQCLLMSSNGAECIHVVLLLCLGREMGREETQRQATEHLPNQSFAGWLPRALVLCAFVRGALDISL